jgi:hypothetical protein
MKYHMKWTYPTYAHPLVQTPPLRLLAEHDTLISKKIKNIQSRLHLLANVTGMEVTAEKSC